MGELGGWNSAMDVVSSSSSRLLVMQPIEATEGARAQSSYPGASPASSVSRGIEVLEIVLSVLGTVVSELLSASVDRLCV